MTPAEHADQAAEQVRALIHATLGTDATPDGYEWPADVDAVLAGLVLLAQRLPQALDQAARWLTRAHRDGRIGMDAAATLHPGDALASVTYRLGLAGGAAFDMGVQLGLAREHTNHMTGRQDEGAP